MELKSLLANLAPIVHVAVPCTFSSKTSTMHSVLPTVYMIESGHTFDRFVQLER